MASEKPIPVAEIISALSFALDLTEDAVPGHALRSCLFGMRIAEEIGLGQLERSDLYYALLLKDVGCSSNSARLCQIIGADERQLKRAVKLEDWTRLTWSGIQMVWRSLPTGSGRLERAGRLLGLGLAQQRNNREMIALRCDRGASIVRKIGLPDEAARAVRHLDEHWDGSGFPGQLKGREIPLLARILSVAQTLDVFAVEKGRLAAIASVKERSGRWFDPDLVAAAESLDRDGRLWRDRQDEASRAAVLDMEPGEKLLAGAEQIDLICEAFAEVVDVKSSFTYAHSRGVTEAALRIGEGLGLRQDRMQLVRRASLLHDLGKLRVPNTVLDKPGKLDEAEWQVVKEHPVLTQKILERVGAFRQLALVAGQHHEKLDGSGYPYGLHAEDLSLEARIIAVADVYGALSEDRPYRPGLPIEEIRRIMSKDVPFKLDADCYEALLKTLGDSEQRSQNGAYEPRVPAQLQPA